MDIRIVSSLTSDDENLVAPALLDALEKLFAKLPVTYMMRIKTADGGVWQHQNFGEPAGKRQRESSESRYQPLNVQAVSPIPR